MRAQVPFGRQEISEESVVNFLVGAGLPLLPEEAAAMAAAQAKETKDEL